FWWRRARAWFPVASEARRGAPVSMLFFFFQAEDGIRDRNVTGVQTCALPISSADLAGQSLGPRVEHPVPDQLGGGLEVFEERGMGEVRVPLRGQAVVRAEHYPRHVRQGVAAAAPVAGEAVQHLEVLLPGPGGGQVHPGLLAERVVEQDEVRGPRGRQCGERV